MKINEGTADRAVRIIIGLGLVGLAIAGIGAPWTWIGLLPLVTGAIGYCPAYTLLGMNTCPMKKE
jgi:hypothetical protein